MAALTETSPTSEQGGGGGGSEGAPASLSPAGRGGGGGGERCRRAASKLEVQLRQAANERHRATLTAPKVRVGL